MNKFFLTITSLTFAFALSAHAEATVTLTGVHNCCKSCANGITKAVESVPGAKATAEKDKVTITAKTQADATKATAALLKAGYYGEGAKAGTASDAKVKSATVTGVHLCCGKCVTAFNNAAKEVGATSDATKGAKSVKVEGDFSPKDLLAALNKNGFNGEVK
jgi:copper chaperone CopZ